MSSTPQKYKDLGVLAPELNSFPGQGTEMTRQYDNYCYCVLEHRISEKNFLAPIVTKTVNDDMVKPLTSAQLNAYRTLANGMEDFDKSWEHLRSLFEQKPSARYIPHLDLIKKPYPHEDKVLGQMRVVPLYEKEIAQYFKKCVLHRKELGKSKDYWHDRENSAYGVYDRKLKQKLHALIVDKKFDYAGVGWVSTVDPIAYQVVTSIGDTDIMVQIMDDYTIDYFVWGQSLREGRHRQGWHHIVDCHVLAGPETSL